MEFYMDTIINGVKVFLSSPYKLLMIIDKYIFKCFSIDW